MNHAFTIIPLTIEAKGEIITNNLPEFRELVREALGNINRDLTTDEEFGQAELDVKALKEAEDAVRAAAVKSFDDKLKALVDELNETADEIRAPRLELEKIIAKRKDEVKSEIIEEFLGNFDIDPKDARRHFMAGLQTAIKGKRTVASMRGACLIYQTTSQANIIQSRESIEKFVSKFGADLVMDRRELELKAVDAVEAELVRRIEAKKAADEQSKLRKEADDAKAEADKARQALAESSKMPATPEPGNIADGPWSGREIVTAMQETAMEVTETQEWAAFKVGFLSAFAPVKTAREGLKHSANIAKAQGLANGINQLWREWA